MGPKGKKSSFEGREGIVLLVSLTSAILRDVTADRDGIMGGGRDKIAARPELAPNKGRALNKVRVRPHGGGQRRWGTSDVQWPPASQGLPPGRGA